MIIMPNHCLDWGVTNLWLPPLVSGLVVAQWLHYNAYFTDTSMLEFSHSISTQFLASCDPHTDRNSCNQFPKLLIYVGINLNGCTYDLYRHNYTHAYTMFIKAEFTYMMGLNIHTPGIAAE